MTTLTPTGQQTLCAALIAAGLAPPLVHRTPNGIVIFQVTDTKGRYLHGEIWRPWEDIHAVWHLVGRFGLSIRQVRGLQGVWRVAHYEEPFTHATTWEEGVFAEIPLMVCRVALRVEGRAVQP